MPPTPPPPARGAAARPGRRGPHRRGSAGPSPAGATPQRPGASLRAGSVRTAEPSGPAGRSGTGEAA